MVSSSRSPAALSSSSSSSSSSSTWEAGGAVRDEGNINEFVLRKSGVAVEVRGMSLRYRPQSSWLASALALLLPPEPEKHDEAYNNTFLSSSTSTSSSSSEETTTTTKSNTIHNSEYTYQLEQERLRQHYDRQQQQQRVQQRLLQEELQVQQQKNLRKRPESAPSGKRMSPNGSYRVLKNINHSTNSTSTSTTRRAYTPTKKKNDFQPSSKHATNFSPKGRQARRSAMKNNSHSSSFHDVHFTNSNTNSNSNTNTNHQKKKKRPQTAGSIRRPPLNTNSNSNSNIRKVKVDSSPLQSPKAKQKSKKNSINTLLLSSSSSSSSSSLHLESVSSVPSSVFVSSSLLSSIDHSCSRSNTTNNTNTTNTTNNTNNNTNTTITSSVTYAIRGKQNNTNKQHQSITVKQFRPQSAMPYVSSSINRNKKAHKKQRPTMSDLTRYLNTTTKTIKRSSSNVLEGSISTIHKNTTQSSFRNRPQSAPIRRKQPQRSEQRPSIRDLEKIMKKF